MILKIANTWADWLVKNGASLDDHEIYTYGAECMLNELFLDILLIITALMFHKTFEIFLWMLFFTPLRIHLGGMHASSHLKCILSSILLSYLCIYSYPLVIEIPALMVIILVVSIFIVYKIAPVVHPNHPVFENRMSQMRMRALVIIFIEIILTCIAYEYFSENVAGMATVSLFSVCILAMMGKIFSTIQIGM